MNKEIILVRHGKPTEDLKGRISAREIAPLLARYDASGIRDDSHPSEELIRIAEACNLPVCSSLPRSIESASRLLPGRDVVSHELFKEASMPHPDNLPLKLSPMGWGVLLRLLSIAGYAKNGVPFKAEKQRAEQAASHLIQLATLHRSVMLVGHGVFNYLLAGELLKQGWKGPKNPGRKHWAFGCYRMD